MIEALLQAERLLVVGLVDQAERIYVGALEQDPLNSIAVVGLARVALERGNDELALEHARRALKIDPQNAAALRLEQRLSEVLALRRSSNVSEPTAAAQSTQDQPVADPEARPSERYFFTRNPSMADHREKEKE